MCRVWGDCHPEEYRGALARGRFDLDRCADEGGPLLHAEQPESLFRRAFLCGVRIEPHAVVFDDEEDRVVMPLEDDVDLLSAGVLGDVGECLLCDTIERRFGF